MTVNTTPISPKECLESLKDLALIAQYPAMLHGAPGIGKTSIVEQLTDWLVRNWLEGQGLTGAELEKRYAEERPKRLKDVRLTTIESVDLRGLPYLNHETRQSTWYVPEFLPTEPGPGVIFLDEITAAERRLQASAYSLLQERRVGEYRVPDGWFIVAAGNGAEHGAIAHEMGSALADRMIHFSLVATAEAFLDHGRKKDFAPEVLSFIQTRPDFLEGCEARLKGDHLIGWSPRGWERVSTLVKKVKNRELLKTMVSGVVGEAAAAEFFFVVDELAENVNVHALLAAKPDERKRLLPQSMVGIYGMTYGLIGAIKDAATLEAGVEIMMLLRQSSIPGVPTDEIAALGMEMLVEKGFDMKLETAMISSPTYKAYYAERKALGLAA